MLSDDELNALEAEVDLCTDVAQLSRLEKHVRRVVNDEFKPGGNYMRISRITDLEATVKRKIGFLLRAPMTKMWAKQG